MATSIVIYFSLIKDKANELYSYKWRYLNLVSTHNEVILWSLLYLWYTYFHLSNKNDIKKILVFGDKISIKFVYFAEP